MKKYTLTKDVFTDQRQTRIVDENDSTQREVFLFGRKGKAVDAAIAERLGLIGGAKQAEAAPVEDKAMPPAADKAERKVRRK